MDIRDRPIVPDLRVYAEAGITKETGRKRLAELQERGEIRPQVTPTGRRLLTFKDAERLAAAL